MGEAPSWEDNFPEDLAIQLHSEKPTGASLSNMRVKNLLRTTCTNTMNMQKTNHHTYPGAGPLNIEIYTLHLATLKEWPCVKNPEVQLFSMSA